MATQQMTLVANAIGHWSLLISWSMARIEFVIFARKFGYFFLLEKEKQRSRVLCKFFRCSPPFCDSYASSFGISASSNIFTQQQKKLYWIVAWYKRNNSIRKLQMRKKSVEQIYTEQWDWMRVNLSQRLKKKEAKQIHFKLYESVECANTNVYDIKAL